ncbi:LacI family transcriptional regulator [Opitutaceae bacterium TAV5]|nr:LacI family transcriptional regulator [Opitutaceae bacterium TAV5]
MAPSRIPTVRELAARLGISHTTVACALRNHPKVAPATRERVLAAAREAGYRNNALVNALMSQVRQRHRLQPTGEVVAYLTSYATEDDWRRHPSHLQQFEGARQRARTLGFDLQPMWLGKAGCRSRQMARILDARGVRGSLLAPISIHHQSLELNWHEHAVVAIGYSFRQMALHRAAHDNISLIFSCYEHLRMLGYRRIGMALHQDDHLRVRYLWRTGFLGSQPMYGGVHLQPVALDSYTDPSAFLRWFDKHKPDAVIGIWPDFTLPWLQERGARVPADVGYATLDLGNRTGQLAGMQQDNRNLGVAAMDMLASQLFRNEIGLPSTPALTLIEGTWIDGPTTRQKYSAGKTSR